MSKIKGLNEVNREAGKFLLQLVSRGAVLHDVECHTDPNMPAYIGGDTSIFNERIDLEFRASQKLSKRSPQRLDPVPGNIVLKRGHKYFYALVKNQVKWTYDIRLACCLQLHEAEQTFRSLGLLGEDGVELIPAPKNKF